MNIAVTGGRDYFPTSSELEQFANFLKKKSVENLCMGQCGICSGDCEVVVFHGAASGVDSSCAGVARYLGYATKEFPADWKTHGKAAGMIRNAKLVEKADVLISFKGGTGTANCISCANSLNIPVIKITTKPSETLLTEPNRSTSP